MTVSGAVRVCAGKPLDVSVAGLPLLLRAVLVMRQAGLSPVRVVAVGDDAACARRVLSMRKLEDVEIVAALPDDRPLVVLQHDVVCEAALVRALADASGSVIAVRDGRQLGLERRGRGENATEPFEVVDALIERVDSAVARARVTRALFERCRKPVDGIVSRHLNRHVSLFLSRCVVETSITPNMTTVATFFVGLLAALAVSRSGYGWTLLGAALLQLNSILDGVDGELARVRHQHSHLGQWLDTLSDDLVNVAFWAGLGAGAAALPNGRLLMHAGFVAAAAQLVLSATYWIELSAIGSGDGYDIDWWFRRAPARGPLASVVGALMLVPKKDFFIFFCLLCASVGLLSSALPVIALGVSMAAIAALMRGLGRLLRSLASRGAHDS